MVPNDDKLIEACRTGDSRAWERVLDKYERLVYSIPLNYGLSMDDAADVTQITFTILLQRLDSLREGSHLGSWLATVAKRHTWRLMKRREREAVGPEKDLAENERIGGQVDHVEDWERVEWLNGGLNLLDERCRDLLIALYFDPDEPTYSDISEKFRMPVGSVGPTRARCLEKLKNLLAIPVS
jgi:RNA polymerase sigma factor (sigma-70 family)